MKRLNRGFTLIELLVVIAIIAILAAILFPVFATAREKARQTSCTSNLKQLGVAFTQYEQDYDEVPPVGNSQTNQILGWAGQIYPYIKSTKAFVCPDDTTPGASCSYAINRSMIKSITYVGSVPYPLWPITQYTSPSRTVLLFEVTGSGGYDVSKADNAYSPSGSGVGASYDPFTSNDGQYNLPCDAITSGACSQSPFTLKYATGYLPATVAASYVVFTGPNGLHNGGSNYLAADGHVKFCLPTMISGGDDDPAAGYCNPTFALDSASGNVFPFAANTACAQTSLALTFSIH